MLIFKRLFLFIIALAIIAFSIAMSGLNNQEVILDLYFFKLELSLGFIVVATTFIGLLIGLLTALFSFYLPLKSQIRKLNRSNVQLLQQKRLENSND
jgi:uncharacterized membrane protein YciS (DUF1049 family)